MKKAISILIVVLPFFLTAQECNFFKHTEIKIEKTQINTSASDFGPSFVNGQLYFSSFTESDIDEISKENSKDTFYDLFSTTIDSKGNVGKNKEILLEEISEGYHIGPVSYCEKTKELFVTLSNYDNPDIKNKVYQKADIRLKIIILKLEDDVWKMAGQVPFNDPSYSVGHPSISETGDTLFFTSNMPGSGMGETDIYMSVKENGIWRSPLNLGNTINTPQNEMFPFYYKNGLLIFASNGRKSSTDLDLYYSCNTSNGFSEPVELNEINSDADDFGLIINDNGTYGFYASRKDGGVGDDDIYKIEIEKGKYDLNLIVRDKKSLKPIPSATVRFSDKEVKKTNTNGIIRRELDYATNYTATSEVEGYMNESISFTTEGKKPGTLTVTINIEKVEVGQKFTLENIFYDFDKWDILPESEIELDKLVKVMKDNPDWNVELGSHTDSRGSDSYNEKLSQKRSDSAVNYIISNGISKDRIIARGYGETQLVNHCDDGVECSEEEHRKNRRTEFKILKM